MKQLYSLFFAWKTETDEKADVEAALAVDNMTEEQKFAKAEKEKEEKRQNEEFAKQKALIEFEDKGGFSQVLKDIFNPSDMAAMELDSVY